MAYITDSWEEIDRNCAVGLAESKYAIGDLKTITLNWGSTSENIDMEIIGFSHDDLADGTGKASITFFSKQLLETSQKMASSNKNTGGWAGFYSLRNWCNNTLFVALPSDLQAVIQEVVKLSDGGQNSTGLIQTTDKCWLASVEEINPYNITNVNILAGQGVAYAGLGGAVTRAKSGGTAIQWWTRTATLNTYKWFYISAYGGTAYDNAAQALGIAFGFCVGSVQVSQTRTSGFLIRSNSTIYTVTDGALTALAETEITASLFQTYGVNEIPAGSLLVGLTDPEVLYWQESTDELPVLELTVKGTPPLPQVFTSEPMDLTHESIAGISHAVVDASEDVRFAISFDGGATWKAHDGSAWFDTSDTVPGMLASTMNSITAEQWAEVVVLESYMLRFWLPNVTAYVKSVVMHYINP